MDKITSIKTNNHKINGFIYKTKNIDEISFLKHYKILDEGFRQNNEGIHTPMNFNKELEYRINQEGGKLVDIRKIKKPNKILSIIKLKKDLFKEIYPLKEIEGVDNFTYHLSNKKSIIEQFKGNEDLIEYLGENLPKGNFLYIDYLEVSPRRRDNGIGTELVNKLKEKCKKIGLDGIYLDSYEESMGFWESKGFSVDADEQEIKDSEPSDYHSAFLSLNSNY